MGLLNIGTEDSKGDQLRRDTYLALKEAGEAGQTAFSIALALLEP